MSRTTLYAWTVDDLTEAQCAELRETLESLRAELRGLLDRSRDGARPVKLDEPIGRLTRMDAIQQQSMTAASRRAYDIRLQQVEQALRAMDQGRYGLCRRCDDPIGHPRLSARPESPYCLDCQEEIDRKHG